MKLAVLSLLVLLAGSGLAPVASALHMCFDAPYLPGALSQYYDMWNNIYRYYTCGHPEQEILKDLAVVKIQSAGLP